MHKFERQNAAGGRRGTRDKGKYQMNKQGKRNTVKEKSIPPPSNTRHKGEKGKRSRVDSALLFVLITFVVVGGGGFSSSWPPSLQWPQRLRQLSLRLRLFFFPMCSTRPFYFFSLIAYSFFFLLCLSVCRPFLFAVMPLRGARLGISS